MSDTSPELRTLSGSESPAIADKNSKTKQIVAMVLLFLFGGIAIAAIFLSDKEVVKDPLNNDEAFRTTTYRPDSFDRNPDVVKPAEEDDDNIIKLPPPPPVIEEKPKDVNVETTQFAVPPPPPITVDKPEEKPKVEIVNPVVPPTTEPPKFPERFKSKSVVLDENKTGETFGDEQNTTGEKSPLVSDNSSQNKFLASVSQTNDRSAKARQIERIDAFVPEGTLIPAILESAIISDLPGQLRAIVSQDVYSFDGRRVLIPTGSRLIGEYSNNIETGQNRIFVVWSRLLRSDGVSVRLNSIGTDSLGRSGLTGYVDKKFKERFGSAILLSVINGATQFVAGLGGGNVSVGNNNNVGETAAQIAQEELTETFANIANTALEDGLKVKPSIYINQGERIFVFVRQDLDFSALYKSPVQEALEEIKKERGLE